MIRILHIVHALTKSGGLSNFIMNYYREIDKSLIQFDFVFFVDVEDSFIEEIESLGGRTYRFTTPSFKNFSFKSEANHFFKEHKNEYCAIHCHALFAAAIYGPIAKKNGIDNIIIHAHSIGYGKGFLRKIRNYYLIKKGCHISNIKLACSLSAAEFMFGKKQTLSGKIQIIPNAIKISKYLFDDVIRNKIRNELRIPSDAFVLGHVGGFTPVKNHVYIIDIFNEVVLKRPNSYLLLLGGSGLASGSTLPLIEKKIKAFNLSNRVILAGVKTNVNDYLMAMDSFVFPSLFEGFGLALVEAQASGLNAYASTNVPKETQCCNLAHYLDLNKGASFWANEIMNGQTINRKGSAKYMGKFDIDGQKSVLESVYLGMIKR